MQARRGVMLLEALVALAILAIVLASAVPVALQSGSSLEHTAAAEARLHEASQRLWRYAAMSAAELERARGSHAEEDFYDHVERLPSGAYRVSIQAHSGAIVLESTLFPGFVPGISSDAPLGNDAD
jgi:type II secretory pathway pseudopilin PulG